MLHWEPGLGQADERLPVLRLLHRQVVQDSTERTGGQLGTVVATNGTLYCMLLFDLVVTFSCPKLGRLFWGGGCFVLWRDPRKASQDCSKLAPHGRPQSTNSPRNALQPNSVHCITSR